MCILSLIKCVRSAPKKSINKKIFFQNLVKFYQSLLANSQSYRKKLINKFYQHVNLYHYIDGYEETVLHHFQFMSNSLLKLAECSKKISVN
jgi:hypothetical protein